MWKKVVTGLLVVILIGVIFISLRFFSSNTAFPEKSKYLYIHTDHATYPDLLQVIKDSQFVKNPSSFDFLAQKMGLDKKIKPGRYEIKKGMSLVSIVHLLRNGRQTPVSLVIKKVRTKEGLAELVSRKLECDSASLISFMDNPDTLRNYELDTNTVMTAVFPDTYSFFWNSSAAEVFNKLYDQYKRIWTPARLEQARQHNLTPATAYILASIVEEETNANDEKGNIASVYLNRVSKGMKLQADPTIKFALRDFGLKRIYLKYLAIESPYNTYRNAGFPPGPICTPSLETLDAVLQSPQTKYLYFVAKSDFSGRHVFSETYREHLQNARAFQKALDIEEQKGRAAREDIDTKK